MSAASWKRKLVAFGLVAAILLSAALLVFGDLSKPWLVAMQVASAVLGAALGSILQVDSARATVENHSGPSIRRLFDQATRLNLLVRRVEARVNVQAGGSSDRELERMIDFLDSISHELRNEINATVTGVEDWGDLSRRTYQAELERYDTRQDRMPGNPSSEGSAGD